MKFMNLLNNSKISERNELINSFRLIYISSITINFNLYLLKFLHQNVIKIMSN